MPRLGPRAFGLAVTTATALLWVGAAPGQAYSGALTGPFQTKTAVHISVDTIGPTQTATVTASVTGPFLAPGGSVSFVDETDDKTLGSATLKNSCSPLSDGCAATATITVSASALVHDENVINAGYGGSLIYAPSGGYAWLDLAQSETTCTAGSGQCSTNFVYYPDSDDATADIDVTDSAPTSGPAETIVVSFGTESYSCTPPGTGGETESWNVTNPGPGLKDVQADIYGIPATNYDDAVGPDYACYDAPVPFTTESGAPATLQFDGSYAGVLPECNEPSPNVGDDDEVAHADPPPATNAPCWYSDSGYFPPGSEGEGSPADYYLDIGTPQNEPRLSDG